MLVSHHYAASSPVIITTLAGFVTFSDILACFQTVDAYLSETQHPMVFWVIDAKRMQIAYGDIIQIVEATSLGVLGSGGDARVIPLMVLDDYIHEHLLAEFENRYIWTQFPNFQTLDEALSFIQYINYLQRG